VLVVPNAPLTSTTGFYALRREAVVDDSHENSNIITGKLCYFHVVLILFGERVLVALLGPDVIRSGPLLRVAPGLELVGEGRRPLGP